MFNRLKVLRDKGYIPTTIFDIGAHHGDWTDSMLNIYPESKYYLFEGINYIELDKFNNRNNINIYKNILLNDKIEEVDWYEEQNTGDSFYKEKSKHFVNTIPIKKFTIDLDTLLYNNNILLDDKIFIKIDCQGAEIPILKGAKNLLNKTDFIVLEIPLFGVYNEGVPNFLEHIKYMDSINFIPYDMVENHYINNFNMQIDMLFINKNNSFNTEVQKLLL